MGKLIIFGNRELAEVAHFYFARESGMEVAAFTVDGGHLNEPMFRSLPVVAFEELGERFPPDDHDMFVAMSYAQMNLVREQKCEAARASGYRLRSFVSRHAAVAENVEIGDNCFILENVVLQPFVRVGNNVTIWSGTHVGHHTVVGDNSFITSHVVISGGVEVGRNCFMGVNATVRDHVRIGDSCLIGAGALILKDTEAEGVYAGVETERSRVPAGRVKRI